METHAGVSEGVVQGVVRQQCWIIVDSVQSHPHSCNGSWAVKLSSREGHDETKVKRSTTAGLLNFGVSLKVSRRVEAADVAADRQLKQDEKYYCAWRGHFSSSIRYQL